MSHSGAGCICCGVVTTSAGPEQRLVPWRSKHSVQLAERVVTSPQLLLRANDDCMAGTVLGLGVDVPGGSSIASAAWFAVEHNDVFLIPYPRMVCHPGEEA